MTDPRVKQVVDQFIQMRQNRRSVLGKAAAFGAGAAGASAFLRSSGALAQATPVAPGASPVANFDPTTAPGATNPLGVDPTAPLDVVIFKGGYGDDYAVNVNTTLYSALYPQAQISYQGITRLGEALQPRFVAGNPPDVIDNSGAGNLVNADLISQGQLADLAPLMGAISFDTEGAKFADTLLPGTQDTGVFSGTQYLLNYVESAYGIWYSKTWMDSKGYEFPDTWSAFIDLCKKIKSDDGVTPFITTGVYPQYILEFVFNQMVWKNGGVDVAKAIDNLEDDAWRADAVRNALTALKELSDNGLITSGWEAWTHTDSQGEWLKGNGIFLPCGTWLENEMKGLIPDDFDMVVAPIPSLDGDVIPFEGIAASAGETFIVPSQGKNVPGGMEWLRLLFSQAGGRYFAENTKSLTVVQGSADGLDLGTAFGSATAAISAAGDNTFVFQYGSWYSDLEDTAKNSLAGLLQGQMDIDDWIDTVQEQADDIKNDDSITKYTR